MLEEGKTADRRIGGGQKGLCWWDEENCGGRRVARKERFWGWDQKLRTWNAEGRRAAAFSILFMELIWHWLLILEYFFRTNGF